MTDEPQPTRRDYLSCPSCRILSVVERLQAFHMQHHAHRQAPTLEVRIRELVGSVTLRTGTPPTPSEIAAAFGVNRGTVHQALQRARESGREIPTSRGKSGPKPKEAPDESP